MPDVYKIFIGGGGDDWFSHIVESYAEQYRKSNPTYQCPYFSWTAGSGIVSTLENAAKGSFITVIGHSYGADTAFSAIQRGRPVNTLISIDPVGRFRPAWATISGRCLTWLNVRAEPSVGNRSTDDTIASLGGKYPPPPAPGQPGAPTYALTADATHGAFSQMMRTSTSNGISGKSLLGGHGV
ncbi:hypothetical protein C8J44_3147 [Sphingomonas sp. PP-CE-3A-406]|uniref:hypothetical protein n=1 Tax=Sphingomonas sp. PP-CE-3A-406 TaxID=2135659 RepID=UPI000EF9D003|nr:hypothetical protein [Sphingomonas sp. PP-CE-3A-406]RMB52119.1 hypothetical protein C8J44_3147 [Sphingomonas sp. PP-CE-3A-406]